MKITLAFLLFAGFTFTKISGEVSKSIEEPTDENSVISFLAKEKELGFSEEQVLQKVATDESIAKKLVSSKVVDDKRGGQKRVILYGTKWCGHGNKAEFEEDLGYLSNLDECCHKHDRCPLNIPAKKEKWGLTNTKGYTISDCKCDDKFYECLKNVNGTVEGKVAKAVGITFFNVLQIKCVKLPKGINLGKNTYKLPSPNSPRPQFRDAKHF